MWMKIIMVYSLWYGVSVFDMLENWIIVYFYVWRTISVFFIDFRCEAEWLQLMQNEVLSDTKLHIICLLCIP